MMVRLTLIFIATILLSSCSGLKEQPAVMENNTFIDNNIPSVMVTFPFDLKMVDKKVDYSDGSRILFYTLKSDNNKTTAIVQKQSLLETNAYYTQSDSSRVQDPLYLSKNQYGYCSVSLFNNNQNSFLRGESIRYISDGDLVAITVFEYIGNHISKEVFQQRYTGQFNSFLNKFKSVCSQNKRQ